MNAAICADCNNAITIAIKCKSGICANFGHGACRTFRMQCTASLVDIEAVWRIMQHVGGGTKPLKDSACNQICCTMCAIKYDFFSSKKLRGKNVYNVFNIFVDCGTVRGAAAKIIIIN